MTQKVDLLIEAVRYNVEGRIELVRAYQRRGAIYSDRLLFTRPALLEALQTGKKTYTGIRKEYLAGTFETRRTVQLVARAGQELIATRATAERDLLEDVPAF